jgi:hypothetical protein
MQHLEEWQINCVRYVQFAVAEAQRSYGGAREERGREDIPPPLIILRLLFVVVFIFAAFADRTDVEAQVEVELLIAASTQHVEEPLIDGDLVPPAAAIKGEVEATQRHGEHAGAACAPVAAAEERGADAIKEYAAAAPPIRGLVEVGVPVVLTLALYLLEGDGVHTAKDVTPSAAEHGRTTSFLGGEEGEDVAQNVVREIADAICPPRRRRLLPWR